MFAGSSAIGSWSFSIESLMPCVNAVECAISMNSVAQYVINKYFMIEVKWMCGDWH